MSKQIIEQWKKYGVLIEKDSMGHWSWAEIFEDNTEGAFSPSFDTFNMVIGDLESCFGPLSEQGK